MNPGDVVFFFNNRLKGYELTVNDILYETALLDESGKNRFISTNIAVHWIVVVNFSHDEIGCAEETAPETQICTKFVELGKCRSRGEFPISFYSQTIRFESLHKGFY